MARTRRLVTSLGRLLSTKAEVIAQIRKRLASGTKPEDAEVAMYMGDVQGQCFLPGAVQLYSEHGQIISSRYSTLLDTTNGC
jgi:Mg2+ and Co2+ transporter CorA